MLERIKKINPAFDKRHPDPTQNYGVHGVEIAMVLKGPLGATQFVVYTNRQLPHVHEEFLNRHLNENKFNYLNNIEQIQAYSGPFTEGKEIEELIEFQRFLNRLETDFFLLAPLPSDLGFHSPKPMYEGHEPMRKTVQRAKFNDGEVTPAIYGEPVPCEFINGPCYYDGSSLNAKRIYQILIRDGEEAVWQELESYYNDLFLEKEAA